MFVPLTDEQKRDALQYIKILRDAKAVFDDPRKEFVFEYMQGVYETAFDNACPRNHVHRELCERIRDACKNIKLRDISITE